MTETMGIILERLPFKNPYDGFDYSSFPYDADGDSEANANGQSAFRPIFNFLIDQFDPKLIVEIGSWKGGSAIQIADMMKSKGKTGLVLCIDTWLGTAGNMLEPNDPVWGLAKYYSNGYPRLYQQFLANVMHRGLMDYILPFPNTSRIGAQWLKYHGMKADIVYVDGSHDEDDVYDDLNNFWDIVRPGGVMLGDDWRIDSVGVVCAVNKFSSDKQVKYQVAGDKWLIEKKVSD